ncbi:HAD family hydrolase [Hydrogenimonas sp.]
MRKVTILFDLDGTLIDSTEAILESFSVALGCFGSAMAEEDAVKMLIGHPLDVMFQRLGVEPGLVEEHVGAYKEHYRKISREKTVLLPGAAEAVERACEFARAGVVTTKTGRYSKELLEHFGLMHRFEVLIGREDVVNPKPHPEPVYRALEALGADAEKTWMIGDTLLDIASAEAAGVTPFALTCGYGSEKELAAACRYLAPDALSAVSRIRTETL